MHEKATKLIGGVVNESDLKGIGDQHTQLLEQKSATQKALRNFFGNISDCDKHSDCRKFKNVSDALLNGTDKFVEIFQQIDIMIDVRQRIMDDLKYT
ncbi:unnamed protein product, partial [Hymenolepis diminuta]